MLTPLPDSATGFMGWSWSQIGPYFQELESRVLNSESLELWLLDWSQLSKLLYESYQRLYVAITVDTTDQQASQQYERFVEMIQPAAREADQKLRQKLLNSGLQPEGLDIPLRNMRAQAALFCQDNLPLLAQELKLSSEYDRLIGDQTVEWDGDQRTIAQLQPTFMDPDRARREGAWRLAAQRQLADREALNALWQQLLAVRRQIAENAGLPDYRAYMWNYRLRFDYSPEDCLRFHQAIEQVVVPAAQRIYNRRRQRLGLDTMRPWDVEADPLLRPALRPFQTIPELVEKTAAIFHKVDPQLGANFDVMRSECLLDLDNRKGKAPGGYCTDFPVAQRPFIFANSVGIHDDVQTLLHEGGHAFHAFETSKLAHFIQQEIPLEFAEVASMSMEFLGAPYLQEDFYTPAEAARARIEYFESCLRFWPYMAVVDAFQHWAYLHPDQAANPSACDDTWGGLWDRFMVGLDWSGLEQEKCTGWQRKQHIFSDPFYYVEYGLAMLGAVQVWRNSLADLAGAVASYRRALALGGTAALPMLYRTAGARLAFDSHTLGEAVELMQSTVEELEATCD